MTVFPLGKTGSCHRFAHGVVALIYIVYPIFKSIIGHAQEGVTQTVYFGDGYTVAQKKEALEGLSWG